MTLLRTAIIASASALVLGVSGPVCASPQASGAQPISVVPAPASPPRAGRPTVTIDALLARQKGSIDVLGWRDDGHLEVAVQRPGDAVASDRALALDGTLGDPLPATEGTKSHDGTARFRRAGDSWRLVEEDGEARAFELPTDGTAWVVSGSTWSLDDRTIAFTQMTFPQGPTAEPVTGADGVPVIDLGARYETADFGPRSRVTLVDRASLEAQTFDLAGIVGEMAWGPDGSLYVVALRIEGDGATTIFRIRPGANEAERFYSSRGVYQILQPTLSPDGRSMALVFNIDNCTLADFNSVVLVDVATGADRRLTRDIGVLPGALVWAPDGQSVYVPVRAGGLHQIWAVPLDGAPRQLTRGARAHFLEEISPDGRRLAYETLDGYGRNDVRVLDLASGAEIVLYTADAPEAEFDLSEWRHVRWQSTDGVHPYGYVFLPPGFNPAKRYPMLVDIHGSGQGSSLYLRGAITAETARGPLEWHAEAARGYVVFVPDYRSTGDYGPDVVTKDFRSGEFDVFPDAEDAVTGVRSIVAQRFVDPERIAIIGHSAGGARAYNAILSAPDLFAAGVILDAVEPDPLSRNMAPLIGASAGRPFPDFVAVMAEHPDRMARNTIFDAANARTPLLIMMGSEERGGLRHWPWEAVFTITRGRGVPARMLIFPEEGHAYSSPQSARRAFNEIMAWLEVYVPPNAPDAR